MKAKIEEILNEENFTDSEYSAVFRAMSEILFAAAAHIEEAEPATAIKYRSVARDIEDMDDFVERIE